MKKILFILAIGLIGVVLGFVIFSNQGSNNLEQRSGEISSASSRPEKKYDQLPNLEFEDYDGNPVALTDFKGKPLVINAWASWCPFCVNELPAFVKVQEELGEAVTIIAVDRSEPRGVAKDYTDGLGISDRLLFVLDPRDKFYKAIGGFSMPETIFVDKDGNIIEHKRGPMDEGEIKQKIQAILE